MICKECNGEIRPSDERCPRCGTPVQWEGGNGFWDLAGQPRPVLPAAEAEPAEGVSPAPVKVEAPARKKGISSSRLLLLLSLFLLLLLFVKTAQLKKIEKKYEMPEENYTALEKENERIKKPPVTKPVEPAFKESENQPEPEQTQPGGSLSAPGVNNKKAFSEWTHGDSTPTPTPAPTQMPTGEGTGETDD